MAQLAEIRKIQEEKYLRHLKLQYELKCTEILQDIVDFDKIKFIIDNKIIEKIQKWFRVYRLSDKKCCNLEDIIDYSKSDIIKLRINSKIYGYHYLALDKHFNINGYTDIKFNNPPAINYI